MVIRDFHCERCTATITDVLVDSLQIVSLDLYCSACGDMRTHNATCNGGTKTRYRLNDWPTDPEFYRGQIKAGKPEVVSVDSETGEEKPVHRYNSETKTSGPLMHSSPRYIDGTDTREIRREKKVYKSRRKRGTIPLTFDQKGS